MNLVMAADSNMELRTCSRGRSVAAGCGTLGPRGRPGVSFRYSFPDSSPRFSEGIFVRCKTEERGAQTTVRFQDKFQPDMPAYQLRHAVAHDGTKLELEYWLPEDTDKDIRTAVVLSHPYGPLGGHMHNNVVDALWRALQNATGDWLLIRFNARYGA